MVSFRPHWSLEQIVRRIKQLSTHLLWEKAPEHLGQFYWGTKRGRLWTGGYFAGTVGDVSEDKLLAYVENQGK